MTRRRLIAQICYWKQFNVCGLKFVTFFFFFAEVSCCFSREIENHMTNILISLHFNICANGSRFSSCNLSSFSAHDLPPSTAFCTLIDAENYFPCKIYPPYTRALTWCFIYCIFSIKRLHFPSFWQEKLLYYKLQ